jgi:hypothetical protein
MSFVNRYLGIESGDTIGSILERNRGIGPGFDWLRIGLSLLIFTVTPNISPVASNFLTPRRFKHMRPRLRVGGTRRLSLSSLRKEAGAGGIGLLPSL